MSNAMILLGLAGICTDHRQAPEPSYQRRKPRMSSSVVSPHRLFVAHPIWGWFWQVLACQSPQADQAEYSGTEGGRQVSGGDDGIIRISQ